MKRWRITGADRASGREMSTVVEADTEEAAVRSLNGGTLLVERVELIEQLQYATPVAAGPTRVAGRKTGRGRFFAPGNAHLGLAIVCYLYGGVMYIFALADDTSVGAFERNQAMGATANAVERIAKWGPFLASALLLILGAAFHCCSHLAKLRAETVRRAA